MSMRHNELVIRNLHIQQVRTEYLLYWILLVSILVLQLSQIYCHTQNFFLSKRPDVKATSDSPNGEIITCLVHRLTTDCE